MSGTGVLAKEADGECLPQCEDLARSVIFEAESTPSPDTKSADA